MLAIIFSAAGVTCTGKRCWSKCCNTWASLAMASPRTGMEPCPPWPVIVTFVQHICFSATMMGYHTWSPR